MVSVASAGTTDRIAARILFNMLRAGSGTLARYSSTLFGAPLPFAPELRLPDFAFFMRVILQSRSLQVYFSDSHEPLRCEKRRRVHRFAFTCRNTRTTREVKSAKRAILPDRSKGLGLQKESQDLAHQPPSLVCCE